MSTRFALALTVLAACGATRSESPAIADLHGSLEPLRAWFDAHAGAPRAILLLSPV